MSTAPANPAFADAADAKKVAGEHFWLWVLCVLGLDYFSTLAYQPSITFHETARLGPLATAVVVFVTLFGALPVYCYLAGRSPGGQGSLGVVEKLIRGWRGKTIVLILLGFAATDFTMLKSLSLADASAHVLIKHDQDRSEAARVVTFWCKDCARNWISEDAAQHVDEQILVTVTLGLIAFAFWFLLRKGFNRNVMVIAVPLVGLYVLLTATIVGGGIWMLSERPEIVTDWLAQLESGQFAVQGGEARDGWAYVILLSLLALPNLALGLSGFEMSMILMPQVQGKAGEHPPRTRIWNTRKVLVVAAIVMSILLLGAVLVTTLLIPPSAFARGVGSANDRALSYLAHGEPLSHVDAEGNMEAIDVPVLPFCGPVFGAVYDIVTVLILCLAGTSVMTALAALMPMFLLRFGMELRWANRWGVMLMIFAGVNVLVTVLFDAHVEEQRGAYATGVLVLIACAAVVTLFDKRRAAEQATGTGWRLLSFLDIAYYSMVALVMVTTMLAVAMRSPSGLGIAFCFIAAILAISIVSRAWRADELRTIGFAFKDEQSRFLWDSLRLMDFPVLVPLRSDKEDRDATEHRVRTEHSLSADADIVFVGSASMIRAIFFRTC